MILFQNNLRKKRKRDFIRGYEKVKGAKIIAEIHSKERYGLINTNIFLARIIKLIIFIWTLFLKKQEAK